MKPDFTQITDETIAAYLSSGGDPRNLMWLWEFHAGNSRGAMGVGNATQRKNQRRDAIVSLARKTGAVDANSVAAKFGINQTTASDDLRCLHLDGRLDRVLRGHTALYSVKSPVRAAKVGKPQQGRCVGENVGVL